MRNHGRSADPPPRCPHDCPATDGFDAKMLGDAWEADGCSEVQVCAIERVNFPRRGRGEANGGIGIALLWCRNFERARWDLSNITSFTWLSLML